jgi:hypothetical protein
MRLALETFFDQICIQPVKLAVRAETQVGYHV